MKPRVQTRSRDDTNFFINLFKPGTVISPMGKNERGQVGVVVAILMVSLFVAVIVLVQVYYVPNWMKDREAEHMDTVANQFSQIKTSIDIETMAQRDVSLINSITLGSKEMPFFVSARAFGSLNILSTANSDFQVAVSGTGLPANSMSDVEKTDGNLTQVHVLTAFDLELTGSQLSHGSYFNATTGDAWLNVSISSFSTDFWQVRLRVANMSAPPVYDQPIAWIPKNASYAVNLLDDGYRFSTRIKPYLTAPFDISFDCTAGGTFVVSGSRYSSGSSIASTIRMGTIRYSSENAYFVDQTYVYEGGAVILNQSQGQAVISAPGITANNVTGPGGARHICDLTVVDVSGAAGKDSVSGYGTYSIRTNYSSMQEDASIASSITITITTNYVMAWERYMESMLNRSGITNYVVDGNRSENRVTVTLNGPQADDTYDIRFTVTRIHIKAQVGPGWVS